MSNYMYVRISYFEQEPYSAVNVSKSQSFDSANIEITLKLINIDIY